MGDRRCESCPVSPDRECLLATARHLCGRPGYRALAARRAMAAELLPLVAACPGRGPVLPVSMQRECGCGELSLCRACRGPASRPGEVTLDDCLLCVSSAFEEFPALGDGDRGVAIPVEGHGPAGRDELEQDEVQVLRGDGPRVQSVGEERRAGPGAERA